MDDGYLCFEYNGMILYRAIAKSEQKIAAGKHTIVVTHNSLAQARLACRYRAQRGCKEVARTETKLTVSGLFTASESFMLV